MYQPPHHREDRLDVRHALIQNHPFGLLISMGVVGLLANAVPFLLQPTMGPLGTLECHMARANGQWRDIDGQQVLVVFQGPQSYISPSVYETKRETGKVVLTWRRDDNRGLVLTANTIQILKCYDPRASGEMYAL